MIDRESRDSIALALRHFATGRTTAIDLTMATLHADDSPDPGVGEISETIYWHYLNMGPSRLTGRHALDRESLRHLARVIVFLRSNEQYHWPIVDDGILSILRALLTLGYSSRKAHREWAASGDIECWPFIDAAQLQRAASSNPFARQVSSTTDHGYAT